MWCGKNTLQYSGAYDLLLVTHKLCGRDIVAVIMRQPANLLTGCWMGRSARPVGGSDINIKAHQSTTPHSEEAVVL